MAAPEGATRLTIYQSILGVIRDQGRDNIDIREAARQIYQRYPFSIHQYQFSSFEAIARRAAYSYELAAELQRNPTRVPDQGEIPTSVGILRPDTPYLYSVLIQAQAPDGQYADTRLDIYSATRLSYADIQTQVMPYIQMDGSTGRGQVRAIARAHGPEYLQIDLLSVVRM